MIMGRLPKTLDVNGKEYEINTDYRDILDIISAFNDKDLKDNEKAFVCVNLLYKDFNSIPTEDIEKAYESALNFIQCGKKPSKKKSPKVINWQKDEQLIFSAINKVAGKEIRDVDYMHWWTFMGYFDTVDRDDLFSYVVMLRSKLARGKKLEKYEREFLNSNRELVALNEKTKSRKQEALDYIDQMFEEIEKRNKS